MQALNVRSTPDSHKAMLFVCMPQAVWLVQLPYAIMSISCCRCGCYLADCCWHQRLQHCSCGAVLLLLLPWQLLR